MPTYVHGLPTIGRLYVEEEKFLQLMVEAHAVMGEELVAMAKDPSRALQFAVKLPNAPRVVLAELVAVERKLWLEVRSANKGLTEQDLQIVFETRRRMLPSPEAVQSYVAAHNALIDRFNNALIDVYRALQRSKPTKALRLAQDFGRPFKRAAA